MVKESSEKKIQRSSAINMLEIIKNAESEQVLHNGERMDSPANLFGILISVYRQRINYTVSDLSKRCGLSEKEILKIEHGNAKLMDIIEYLPSLASSLRVNPSTLSRILISWIL